MCWTPGSRARLLLVTLLVAATPQTKIYNPKAAVGPVLVSLPLVTDRMYTTTLHSVLLPLRVLRVVSIVPWVAVWEGVGRGSPARPPSPTSRHSSD